MCGGGGPPITDIEEVSWKKYHCDACGHDFRMLARIPRCPKCRSDNISLR
jgi:predicted Zn-ribbon and HTH transcriptional regulator